MDTDAWSLQLDAVVSPPRLSATEVMGTAVHTRAVVGGLSSVYRRLLKECSALERSVDSLQRQRDRSAVAAVASHSPPPPPSPFFSHGDAAWRSTAVVSELHAAQTTQRQERMALLAQARAPPPPPPPSSPPVARRACCSRGLSDHVCQLTRLTPLKSRPMGQLSLSPSPPPPPLLEVR